MRCDYAFLCDFASDKGNSINALGIGYDLLLAPQLPATHPHFFLVSQLRASVVEVGKKSLGVRLIDEDGQVLLAQDGQLQFERPLYGTESVARLVLGFYMVQIPKYGAYSFHVTVEGLEMARIPFTVVKPPAQ